MSGAWAESQGIRPYRYEQAHLPSNGSIEMVGERMVCHICGRDYEHLQGHIRVHGISAAEYRREFGLPNRVRLVSDSIREKLRHKAMVNGGRDRIVQRNAGITEEERARLSRAANQAQVEQARRLGLPMGRHPSKAKVIKAMESYRRFWGDEALRDAMREVLP